MSHARRLPWARSIALVTFWSSATSHRGRRQVMSARIVHLREAGSKRNATSEAKGRGKNEAYRTREHLTEAEVDKLLAALKRNRHGHRDWLIGLLIFLESRLLAP